MDKNHRLVSKAEKETKRKQAKSLAAKEYKGANEQRIKSLQEELEIEHEFVSTLEEATKMKATRKLIA